MRVTKIELCRACGSAHLRDLLSLGNQYVSDFLGTDDSPLQAPLDLVRCIDCNLVQLKHTVDRNLLYRHYWYKSGISSMMKKALRDIAVKSFQEALPKPGDLVLDIGCNDGTLLHAYSGLGTYLYKVGFEPARNLVGLAASSGYIFNNYFNAKTFQSEFAKLRAQIITSIAMFYDLEFPNTFVRDVKGCLAENGIWVIQQNYLGTMLQNNGLDNINHEHLEYYSLGSLQRLLERHGLEVYKVELNDVNGGSFRTYVVRFGSRDIDKSVSALLRQEERWGLSTELPYERFANNITMLKEHLRGFIAERIASGKKVLVYGASTRGNTLLQYCGLDNTFIEAATDKNPEKWGKRTVGTNIPIIPRDEALARNPDYFLILPHHLVDEFRILEHDYLRSGGKFIVPLPNFRIVQEPIETAPTV